MNEAGDPKPWWRDPRGLPPDGWRTAAIDSWPRRHPWWFGLVSALIVTTPGVAIAVWKDWALGDLAPTLVFTFLLWFVGRAILMRRSQRTESR